MALSASITLVDRENIICFRDLIPEEIYLQSRLCLGICVKDSSVPSSDAPSIPCGITALEADGDRLVILYFYIGASYRGQGLGEKLLDAIKETAKSVSADKIEITFIDRDYPDFLRFLMHEDFDYGDWQIPFFCVPACDLKQKFFAGDASKEFSGHYSIREVPAMSIRDWNRFTDNHPRIAWKNFSYYSDGSFLVVNKENHVMAGIFLKRHGDSVTFEYMFNQDRKNSMILLFLMQRAYAYCREQNADFDKIYFLAMNEKVIRLVNALCENAPEEVGRQIDLLYFTSV